MTYSLTVVAKMKLHAKSINSAHILCVFLIVIAGVAGYFNTLSSPFVFDDNHAIVENRHLLSWSKFTDGMNLSNRRYLTNFTFFVNYQLGKANPFGYHVVNIIIHIATGLSAYWLTYLLCAFASQRNPSPQTAANSAGMTVFSQFQNAHIVSLIAAVVFVVHPLQTQAVTYIVQRATSLSGLFYLLTLTFYFKAFFRRGLSGFSFWYFGSLILCILGMFTKENFYTAPVTILLCELLFLRKYRTSLAQSFSYTVPFLATLVILPCLLYLHSTSEHLLAQRVSVTPVVGRYEYFLTQFRSYRIYTTLLFYPAGQRIEYNIPKAESPLEPDILIGIIAVLGLLIAAVVYRQKNALFSFGIFFALLAISVESSLIPLPDMVFEHRMYLPLYGVIIALLSLIVPLVTTLNQRRLAGACVTLILLALTIATHARNAVWSSVESVWRDVIEKEPLLARPHLGLGQALASSGRLTEAISEFKKSLALDSNADEVIYNIGRAHVYLNSPIDTVIYWMEKTVLSHNSPSFLPVANHVLSAEQVVVQSDIDALKTLYLSPIKRRAIEQLIVTYNSGGNPAASAAIGERVAAAFPGVYCSLYNDLGVYHLKLRDYTRALHNLDMARKCGFNVAPEFYNFVSSLYTQQHIPSSTPNNN